MEQPLFAAAGDTLNEAPEGSAILRIRAELMLELGRLVRVSGLSELEMARILGVSKPRLQDLLRGEIERFSVDELVKMLSRI